MPGTKPHATVVPRCPRRGEEGGGENVVSPPSLFVLMAEGKVSMLHALHLNTKWAREDFNGGNSTVVVVAGLDYVTTVNVVHLIYSLCVVPPGAPSADRLLGEEHNMDLCCLQSKVCRY